MGRPFPGRRITERVRAPCRRPAVNRVGPQGDSTMFKAIADVLGKIGSAIATVVSLPFRAVARLFGGASDTAHGHH